MRRDDAYLLDMLIAARDAISFVRDVSREQFASSRIHQQAVTKALETIGEAAGRVSKSFCAAHPEIPWKQMTGMRHRLIHDYGDVRLDIVWRVTQETLPGLIAMLRPLVPPKTDQDE